MINHEVIRTDLAGRPGASQGKVSSDSVSVIVPTFNRAMYINECIDSLLAQSIPPLEIIVIDDGSTDATDIKLGDYDGRIKYIKKENGGKPSAVNLGLRSARGEWIWIMDDDDVALPDAIESRLAALTDHPDAGFVYSSHLLGSDDTQKKIVRGRLCNPPTPSMSEFFFEIMRGCFFHLNSALVRRSLYESLGGLDPQLLSSEDYDFQIRLSRVAIPAFSKAPSFIFRQHDGVRGAAQIRYAAVDRGKIFKRYSQTVGLKLRRNLALGEYLCPPTTADLSDAGRREALLNRIHVMANHGCVEELIQDLSELLQLVGQTGQALTRMEHAGLAAAFKRGWAFAVCGENWHAFEQSLHRIKAHRGGRAAVRTLSRSVLQLATGYPGTAADRAMRFVRAVRLLGVSLS